MCTCTRHAVLTNDLGGTCRSVCSCVVCLCRHVICLQGGRVVSKRGEAGSAEVPTHEAFHVASRTWAAQPSMLQHRTALAAASLQVNLDQDAQSSLHAKLPIWSG